jgi:XTP/dITP diphosphohydrolase
MQLVIASRNVHKLREFRAILLKSVPDLDIFSLIDFPEYQPPEESGATFEENAILKAVHAAHSLQKWVLSDDSGLVVPALQGAPGVFSARYAGSHATDAENRKKLLGKMGHLSDTLRQAYFECWIALASPEGLQKVVKGLCEGVILDSERGRQGFGYDSIFVKHGYGKSFGELDDSTKNEISHRRKAFSKMLPTIKLVIDQERQSAN